MSYIFVLLAALSAADLHRLERYEAAWAGSGDQGPLMDAAVWVLSRGRLHDALK